jgi:hypothetical protein
MWNFALNRLQVWAGFRLLFKKTAGTPGEGPLAVLVLCARIFRFADIFTVFSVLFAIRIAIRFTSAMLQLRGGNKIIRATLPP